MIEKLLINVNGIEKYATGLSKETTIDEIKLAMLYTPGFRPDNLKEYAFYENWQNNERILEGHVKIYKIIRIWQSLPGDQLSQVQFSIRKIFKFCSLSPEIQKTWNESRLKRKSTYVKRELLKLKDEEDRSSSRKPRFASIKRNSQSRQSSIVRTPSKSKKLEEKSLNELETLKQELDRIDQLIRLKSKIIQTIETESLVKERTKKILTASSSASSIKSNDTGISSAPSIDVDQESITKSQLETLV